PLLTLEDFRFRGPVGVCLGQAPYITPGLFVGRSSELHEIAQVLQSLHTSHKQQRLLIVDHSSVFWLNAASEAALKDSFRSVASLIFSVQDPGVLQGNAIVGHVHQWLSDLRNTGWLLVFDNYDEPSQFEINDYYPPASHGTVVVTTRRPDLVAGSTLHIKPLRNIEDGLAILQSRTGFTFERYLQEYETRLNIDPRRPTKLQEYRQHTLYTTWDLSYDHLKIEDPDAAKFLRLLAYFDNQSLWYELFRGGLTSNSHEWLREVVANDVTFHGVMGILSQYYFLEVDRTSGS
ncbi:hypothetical protein N7474_002984, partial [Penicillium riverlandense]|uniref:uncharacterized protein n=1 Tax=Penicillium riverlandense TaxID=1903569 RepID=UPI002547AF5D